MNGKDFVKGWEQFIQERERQIQEIADIIRIWGISPQTSISIAREIYRAGWRKTERNDNETYCLPPFRLDRNHYRLRGPWRV